MADDSWHYLDLVCPNCGGKVRHYFDFNVCEDCHYTLPDSNATQAVLYNIRDDGTGMAYGKLEQFMEPYTVHIDCDKIQLFQKGLDIEFTIESEKLENIDVIEINGHRFVREK